MIKSKRVLGFLFICTVLINCSKDRLGIIEQIPNGDFENWSQILLPDNWKTNSCPLCDPPFESYVVQKDSAAFHGRYDAKFIYNNVYVSWAENKFPLRTHPFFLGGYFKCKINEGDTITIKIWLYKNAVPVDSGDWHISSSIPEYMHLNVPVSQKVSQIDTARIRIMGGHSQSVLWVDDLDLE